MEDQMMFCYQCEQTAKGEGCTRGGVCGKDPETAALQDLLTYSLVGLSQWAVLGRKVKVEEAAVNRFIPEALFMTLTNVDFDPDRLVSVIGKAAKHRDALRVKIQAAGNQGEALTGAAQFVPAAAKAELIAQGRKVGLKSEPTAEADQLSLRHILLFGLRGTAAYAHHARLLGQEDPAVYAFLQEGLVATRRPDLPAGDLVGLVLKCGEINLRAMELLDAGHTATFGHPVPTPVSLGHKKGKAILVSGHDLIDLENLLKQTAGKGINIYTHGEMLPAHGYPGLKKYAHLAGHYGTAWQNQATDFAGFPGAILMTTNCIQRPRDSYKENIFTTGTVGWPGVTHVEGPDFSPVIARAQALAGFAEDLPGKEVLTGFAHNAVLGVADKVIEAVKSGAIRHFFLVGGCDGAKPGRNYYTEFVEKAPADTIILTLACGKFRFFDRDLGTIGGIPRLLDVGQCNDAYSAVKIAVALAGAFKVGVNELPLSLILSWYEQKAVSILLSLLHLGIKGIRLGPSLPAFITPGVLKVLVDNFDIKPIGSAEGDLKAILG
jgi:hydroxylamine reductase